MLCPEELAPTSFYGHLYDRFGVIYPGKRLGIDLSDEQSQENVVNINSSKNLDTSFDIATSGEEVEESSQHDNNYILSDNMKVIEEYSDSRFNCSNSTTSLNVEIWDENKLRE